MSGHNVGFISLQNKDGSNSKENAVCLSVLFEKEAAPELEARMISVHVDKKFLLMLPAMPC